MLNLIYVFFNHVTSHCLITLWVVTTMHCYTENLSGEFCRDLPRDIQLQREGGGGGEQNQMKWLTTEGKMSEMIDQNESAVKWLEPCKFPKTALHR